MLVPKACMEGTEVLWENGSNLLQAVNLELLGSPLDDFPVSKEYTLSTLYHIQHTKGEEEWGTCFLNAL